MTTLAELRGLARSLAIYRCTTFRHRSRRSFYRDFVEPGDLCFDVGAHAGNHLAAWLGLGARVVAIEPQPQFANLLHRIYGNEPRVTLVEAALGAEIGEAMLHVSSRTPTVSTLSPNWVARVSKTPGFHNVTWDREIAVPVTTLDCLIAEHGVPAFCKIDVEGLEDAVLEGLSRPLPALSIEYIPAARYIAVACLKRLTEIGECRFNAMVGESLRFVFPSWQGAQVMSNWLDRLKDDDRSGDICCLMSLPQRTAEQ